MIEIELRTWGNSIGAIFPRRKLRELGLRKGDKVDIEIINKKRIDGFGISKGSKPLEEEKEEHDDLWG